MNTQQGDGGTEVPTFAVTVELVVLTIQGGTLHVLVVQREQEPFAGRWALPGRPVREHESLEEAALLELQERTGVLAEPFQIEQIGAFGAPDRDPRRRVVSIAWLALLPEIVRLRGGGGAPTGALRQVGDVWGRLAFDHDRVLARGVDRAGSLIEHTDAALAFCGREFTVSELRRVYEAIWDTPLEPSNFHRMAARVLEFADETPHKRDSSDRGGRPSSVYRYQPAPEGGRRTLPTPLLRPERRSLRRRRSRWDDEPGR